MGRGEREARIADRRTHRGRCRKVNTEPQPATMIIRSKPAPEPAPIAQPTPEPVVEYKVVEATPMTAPIPAPEEPKAKPEHLPKTASPMGLIGLIGLVSMTGYVT